MQITRPAGETPDTYRGQGVTTKQGEIARPAPQGAEVRMVFRVRGLIPSGPYRSSTGAVPKQYRAIGPINKEEDMNKCEERGVLTTEYFWSDTMKRELVQWDYRDVQGKLYSGISHSREEAKAAAEKASGETIAQ